ncbi:helix-turn-helix domain-containing protein [Halobaculum litoreum]|uniref:Helix-turn-helix domain-containing protein n=1 Tax=Halobaculum litoreum TaxID=3031998 RepID=A0ABD5XW21_9EURY
MARANLRVTLPDDTWVGSVSRDYPGARLSVLSVLPTGEGSGVTLVSLRADDAPAVVRDIEQDDQVTEVELQRAAEDVREVVLRVETTDPRLLKPLRDSRLPVEFPLKVADGVAELTVAGSRERLSALATALEASGMEFSVGYVHEALDAEDLLTESQRRLLTAAIRTGYYDTPRDTTLTELADRQGIAKSTASERLHRAEEGDQTLRRGRPRRRSRTADGTVGRGGMTDADPSADGAPGPWGVDPTAVAAVDDLPSDLRAALGVPTGRPVTGIDVRSSPPPEPSPTPWRRWRRPTTRRCSSSATTASRSTCSSASTSAASTTRASSATGRR